MTKSLNALFTKDILRGYEMTTELNNIPGKQTARISERPARTHMSRGQVMKVSLIMGKILLKSGAETSRVEDTMMRFCRNHGYEDINVFCTPTVIMLGDEEHGGPGLLCRIRSRAIDLGLIMYMTDLSYNNLRWNMTYDEVMDWIHHRVDRARPYGKWTLCLATGLGSACFSVLLGGNYHDFLAAFINGFIATVVIKQLAGIRPSAFWENCLGGFIIGAVAMLACQVDKYCTASNIIVGALMPFVPGLPFTNGLRDYIAGDLLSGNSRIAEAVLLSLAVAIGIAIALRLWVWWGIPV